MTTSVYDYDRVAASNTDLGGNNVTGTGLVSTADNSFRGVMAHLRDLVNDFGGVNTVGGTGNAITITLSGAPTALTDGMRFSFNASAANSGATTIVVTPNGGAAFASKALRRYSGGTDIAMAGGEIAGAGQVVDVIYDAGANAAAGAWIMTNTIADVTLTGTQTLTNKTLTSPTINTPTLILKQSAAPAPTAEGDIQWDTDDNRIVVGDGASQQIFYPQLSGTWTPAFSATGCIFSYATQYGGYRKVNDLVTIWCELVLNTSGNTLAGNTLTVTGLPFTPAASPGRISFPCRWTVLNASYVQLLASITGGNAALNIEGIIAAGASNGATQNASGCLSATLGSAIRFSGSYLV